LRLNENGDDGGMQLAQTALQFDNFDFDVGCAQLICGILDSAQLQSALAQDEL